MHLPTMSGLIRRRLLVNFRIDAAVMARYLPAPFQPKLHRGNAIAGICLIRLEQIRPRGLPRQLGLTSENAAHRIAVEWDDEAGTTREGVFVPRRDTSSRLNHLVGGRIFPGEHRLATFAVADDGEQVALSARSRDGSMSVEVRGHATNALPTTSCFGSLAESSAFFEGGSVGYSVTRDCCRLDGIRLEVDDWQVRAFAVEQVRSSFFEDAATFPAGSVVFDHALVMRKISHRWRAEPDLFTTPREAVAAAG